MTLLIEEFVDDAPDLIKQQRVQLGRHFLSDQLLDMLLNLRPKFLVVANQQPQKLTDEPDFNEKYRYSSLDRRTSIKFKYSLRDWAILNILCIGRKS